VVKILHSIAKFADADGPEELSRKIFGFYGERTKYGPPAPLMLPEKNAWEWNKKAICAESHCVENVAKPSGQ
jgi:hypothetical protein